MEQKAKRKPKALYEKTPKVYPRKVEGFFDDLRRITLCVLLGLYFIFPWITWNGQQAVLFDLPARKFHYFGTTLWPQDFIYLSWLLIIAALALFFFTTWAGRLWCGYSCPQTAWTECFLWLEHQVEGDRRARMALDKAPMSFRKFRLKFTKHTLWVLFSLYTGFTFVGYFTPVTELTYGVLHLELGPWEWFWFLFYSFATYGNAGWLREQLCIYMCPYARFQSAMFDQDTLIISYDAERGEPRGKRSKKAEVDKSRLGDCIDCNLCVQVCPTGIDIRDGLQYQCIACAACIDACDGIMQKMNYPKGLVKYTTDHTEKGQRTKILRPRLMFYAFFLLALYGAFLYSLINRIPIEVDIIRDREKISVELPNGQVENLYDLKFLNMDQKAHQYKISVEGIPDIAFIGEDTVFVNAGEVKSFPVRLVANKKDVTGKSVPITFFIKATDDNNIHTVEESRFIVLTSKSRN